MTTLKRLLMLILDGMAALLLAGLWGRHIKRRAIARIFSRTTRVTHKSIQMDFAVPNWLTEYRADSFSSKEPETLEWIESSLSSDSVLWDVGANVGMYSVYAAKARGCRVYAFEPSVFNLELLARNVYYNRLYDQIHIVPLALSDAAGVSRFRMSSTEWGGALSSFDKAIDQNGAAINHVFEYSIYGVEMDQVVDWMLIPQPNAIKMDVDGVEHFILSGGRKVLASVDTVLVEVNEDFAEQRTVTEQVLREAGLTLYRKCDCGSVNQFNQWWVRK
jgi:FkbM family methyltransferase